MSQELKPCPFCGGECYWCDSVPDDDGDTHRCDHIICKECKMDFTSIGEATYACETIEQSKEITKSLFNTRALTPKQQCADEMYELLDVLADMCCESGNASAMRKIEMLLEKARGES